MRLRKCFWHQGISEKQRSRSKSSVFVENRVVSDYVVHQCVGILHVFLWHCVEALMTEALTTITDVPEKLQVYLALEQWEKEHRPDAVWQKGMHP